MVGYCENCLNQHKEELCRKCADNPQIIPMVSYYTPYLEVCPIKEWGCNNDPGFIKYFFPERYEKLFGNITLKEAIEHENSKCKDCEWRKKE